MSNRKLRAHLFVKKDEICNVQTFVICAFFQMAVKVHLEKATLRSKKFFGEMQHLIID